MQQLLADILWSKCLIHLEDRVRFVVMFKETLMNLQAALERLSAVHFKLKPKKREFLRIEVEYLGHKLSKEGITLSPKKVATIHEWNPPQNVSEVKTQFY